MLVRTLWIKYIIDTEVRFVGCLYMTNLFNALKMEHIKMSVPSSRDVLVQPSRPISKGKALEPWIWDTGCPETSETTNLHRVSSKKREDLTDTADAVRNYELLVPDDFCRYKPSR